MFNKKIFFIFGIILFLYVLASARDNIRKKPIYDATGYLNKNSANRSIFLPITILYQNMLLPHGTDNIDTGFLANYAKKLPYTSTPYIIDIEAWNLRPNVSDYIVSKNIDKYILVIKTLKKARPELRFGYYGTLPTRDYVSRSPIMGKKYQKWHHSNERLKKLSLYVDVICPDLYTFFDDEKIWKQYATAAVREARMYEKPIYPFIWPEFHDSNKALKGVSLSANFWKQQLIYLNKIADGIIIWGGRDVTVNPHISKIWNENDPWWITTKAFILKSKNFNSPIKKNHNYKKNKSIMSKEHIKSTYFDSLLWVK